MAQEIRRLVENASAEDPFLDATPAAARELAPGQVLCERFELLRLVGEGGMGQVWAADDRRLSETIAVKTIQRGLAGEGDGLKRLQRELQLARRIGHAHVCRVFELFEDTTFSPSRVFVTMELLEGETLASRLRREGRLVPAEALRFFQQIVSGLDAVHAAGVVHRDLKPSNIMLSTDAATGQERAVVMDFGLARALDRPFHVSGTAGDADLTRTGQAMGTFEYMAPEQVRAEPATAVTDVYALGLILFEMLDGQPPFAEQNTMGSWMRRMREVPPKLAEGAVPGLDPRVDEVIAKCLEFEPSARFPVAGGSIAQGPCRMMHAAGIATPNATYPRAQRLAPLRNSAEPSRAPRASPRPTLQWPKRSSNWIRPTRLASPFNALRTWHRTALACPRAKRFI
jgi:serine/threonine protein kinase